MARAQAMARPVARPGGGKRERDAAEGTERPVTEEPGVLLEALVDARERRRRRDDVVRRRLVELGHDEGEEGVHAEHVRIDARDDPSDRAPLRRLGRSAAAR